jgi:hypothetical protein
MIASLNVSNCLSDPSAKKNKQILADLKYHIYIYKRLRPRKKIRNRKKERATEILKLNTKPLKFKCGLADGGGGGRYGRPMQGMGTPT